MTAFSLGHLGIRQASRNAEAAKGLYESGLVSDH